MMSQKLRGNDKHMSELQNGFDKIKSVTGFTDLSEIVDKFLSRHKTNAALKKALNEMETATDEATEKNKALESRLSELQLEDLSGQGKRNLYKDIDEKDAKVKEAKKVCIDQQERAQKCNMILQNIRQCVGKLHAKLNKTKGAVTGKENMLPNVDELPTIIGKIEQDVKLMLDDLTHLMPSKSVDDADNIDRESRPASGSIRSNNSSKIDLKKSSPSSKQAADVLFNSIMAVNLDTSPRNVRVPIMTNSAIKSRPHSRVTAYSRSSSRSKQSHKIVDEMEITEPKEDEEAGQEEDEDGEVFTRRALKRMGRQIVQQALNKDNNKGNKPHVTEVQQQNAASRLMQGQSTIVQKTEANKNKWQGEKPIDLELDDPFAKQTAILQERRLQQRQGVLEIDHVQPHPPKDEKKNGSVSKNRRKSKIK